MKREWSARVGGADSDITVETRDEGRWRVIVDGRGHDIDAVQIKPGTWSVLIDGASWLVDIDHRKAATIVLADGTRTQVELVDARRKRLAEAVHRDDAGGDGGGVIAAPIAGKVVKLLVEAGASVEAGQGVAVLEAMKMENEIKATCAGVVATIHVAAGQSVETNEPLVTLSAP